MCEWFYPALCNDFVTPGYLFYSQNPAFASNPVQTLWGFRKQKRFQVQWWFHGIWRYASTKTGLLDNSGKKMLSSSYFSGFTSCSSIGTSKIAQPQSKPYRRFHPRLGLILSVKYLIISLSWSVSNARLLDRPKPKRQKYVICTPWNNAMLAKNNSYVWRCTPGVFKLKCLMFLLCLSCCI